MKTLTVGELKAQLSDVLKNVQAGEPVAITYGKKRMKLAMLVAYHQYCQVRKRKLGVLQEKASYHIHDDFKMIDEDILKS